MTGLAALGSVPEVVGERRQGPVIDHIKAALGKGSEVASQESLRQAVGSVFRILVGA